MLAAQSKIISIARKHLESRDQAHMLTQHSEPTSFPINSFVLLNYIDRPPTSLHAPLAGPYRVVSSIDGKYTLQNIVTEELTECHVSRLRPFYYDEPDVPRQTAMRDSQQWDVDYIIEHSGHPDKRSEMYFKVKWLNYDVSSATWEPYSHLRDNEKLHEYLRTNKLKRLIPRKFSATK